MTIVNKINKLKDFCELGRAVIEVEANAVAELASRIDNRFASACEYMYNCKGRIVVIGMGKSGHIGGKIAATLASTGTPAFFVHPSEANHGDIGMVTKNDVVIAISNSGNTTEIITLLPVIKRLKIPLIALSGNSSSPLAKAANVTLDISVSSEACPLGLAPTSSTTAALVMGDALAIALLEIRGFTKDDFALSHPGGHLGRRLLLLVDDLLHSDESIPSVSPDTLLARALVEMTKKGLGMTTIVDNNKKLLGIFTDGDLRRVIDQGLDIQKPIADVMTKYCKTVALGTLAIDALTIMENHKITSLVATDKDDRVVGVLHMHDLLQAGVV